MADFSRREIEEAKKRVREMQKRANSYIGADSCAQNQSVNHNVISEKTQKKQTEGSPEPLKEFKEGKSKAAENETEEGSDSNFIILMLLILLSHEGADRKLLLALLYLLF